MRTTSKNKNYALWALLWVPCKQDNKKAVPSRSNMIPKVCGVMQELHVGRGFLYPPAVPLTAADGIWNRCTDTEMTSTVSFLLQGLLLEKRQ